MRRWLPLLPALAALGFRLAHLGDVAFVSPDGATYLRYDLLVFTQRLPFYPLLIHTMSALGLDLLLAAKLVSALGAAVAVYLAALIAEEVGLDERHSWLAALPLAVDPLFTLHSVQPLTEGPFAALAALATWFALRVRRTRREFDLFGLVFFGGLAALTRGEGLVFAPLCLWEWVWCWRTGPGRVSAAVGFGAPTWALLAIWQTGIVGRAGYLGEFGTSVAAGTAVEMLWRAVLHLKSLFFHLAIVGVIPLALGARDLLVMRRFSPPVRQAIWLLVYLIVATWAGISVHWYFDLRFATPLMLWLAPVVGLGWRRILAGDRFTRRLGQSLIFAHFAVWLVVSSAMIRQVSTLARDVARAGQIAGRTLPTAPLLSDEQAMTSYYAGRLALAYRTPLPFRRVVVVLHDRYTDLVAQRRILSWSYDMVEVASVKGEDERGVAWRAVVWIISRRPGIPAVAGVAPPATAPGG